METLLSCWLSLCSCTKPRGVGSKYCNILQKKVSFIGQIINWGKTKHSIMECVESRIDCSQTCLIKKALLVWKEAFQLFWK